MPDRSDLGCGDENDGGLSVNLVANFEVLDIRATGFDTSRKVATERDGELRQHLLQIAGPIFKSLGLTPTA